MVPVGSSVMLELVLTVHSYHVIAYSANQHNANFYNSQQPVVYKEPRNTSVSWTGIHHLYDFASEMELLAAAYL